MKGNNFSTLPSVSISRSKFNRKSQHKTSLKIGEITPIYIDEVLPGDTRKIDLGALIRMSTPIAPIMDNIYLDVYAFFVPNRLTWSHWKEFMGENSSGAGIYSGTAYKIPTCDLYASTISVGSLGDHMGLPICAYNTAKHLKVSALPIRGYLLNYNRFFRDQNLIAPITVSTGDTASESYNMGCLKAAKFSDYFTRSLPYAQKGAPVSIPLGTTASIIMDNTSGNSIAAGTTISMETHSSAAAGEKSSLDGLTSGSTVGLYADLSNATAATINQLRFAFQYQKMLEKDSLYGTRLNAR